MLNTEKIIEKIIKTDIYKDLVQEETDKLVAERQAAVQQIKDAEKEYVKKQKEIDAKLKKIRPELKAAREKLKQLEKVVGDLNRESSNASSVQRRASGEAEKFLKKTADQKIFDAIYKCKYRQRDIRDIEIVVVNLGKRFDPSLDRYVSNTLTNRGDLEKALEYSRGCVKEIKAMIQEPALDSKKLDKLLDEHEKNTSRIMIRQAS